MNYSDNYDQLLYNVKKICIDIHKTFGPGLLENAYKQILVIRLKENEYDVKTEVYCPLKVGETVIKDAFRIDLLINNSLIVELKTVNKILPVHHRQLITYMTLYDKPIGLLVNFYCNNLYEEGLRSWKTSDIKQFYS